MLRKAACMEYCNVSGEMAGIFFGHTGRKPFWDQRNNSCHLHEILKEDHFAFNPSSRMRNKLAKDVLDKTLYLMKVNVLAC